MNNTLLVITTYNQSEYTKACFETLRNIEDGIDVLVIDDCSTDDTVELCKEYNHEVIVKETGLGLTDSWNRGYCCLLYTSPSPRDVEESRMPSSA